MTTYDVPCDVSGEMHLAGYGAVAFTIEAGPFVPATPELEKIAERLVAAGIVSVATPKPTTKKKAEPVAAVEEPEE